MRHSRAKVGAGAKPAKFAVAGLEAMSQPPIHQITSSTAMPTSANPPLRTAAETRSVRGIGPRRRRASIVGNDAEAHSANTSVRLNGSLGLTLGSFFHSGNLFIALRTKS